MNSKRRINKSNYNARSKGIHNTRNHQRRLSSTTKGDNNGSSFLCGNNQRRSKLDTILNVLTGLAIVFTIVSFVHQIHLTSNIDLARKQKQESPERKYEIIPHPNNPNRLSTHNNKNGTITSKISFKKTSQLTQHMKSHVQVTTPTNNEVTTTNLSNEKLMTATKDNASRNNINFKQQQRPVVKQCTKEQFEIIEMQLSPKECMEHQNSPWTQCCSFTVATRCPNPTWLKQEHDHSSSSSSNTYDNKFKSIFVGCNKAIDAVETLYMGSNNPKHSVDKWIRKVWLVNGVSTELPTSCNQFARRTSLAKQKRLQKQLPSPSQFRDASVYCIEPIPTTFEQLNWTKNELGSDFDDLVLDEIALSDKPGTIRVPKAKSRHMGVENIGLDQMKTTTNCNDDDANVTATDEQCKDVPIMTLDDYTTQYHPEILASTTTTTKTSNNRIQYLSIDVEGFDYEVLIGGFNTTLKYVEYLEFEYNWVGQWKRHKLSGVINSLKDQGFVCYWPGSSRDDEGQLWRITDCFMEYYDIKFWSNVACVQPSLVPSLASRMEELFLQTLAKKEMAKVEVIDNRGKC